MTYTYTVYGLTLSTPFPCTVLPPASPQASPDVTVIEGEVPFQLTAPVVEELRWQAEAGRYLYRGGRRAGRFLVEDGKRVTLQRSPAAEDEMLAFAFLDFVLAAILRQRGLLVLHANTALTPQGAVAISGGSGAGKSTTLTALLQQGCAMISDDITALHLGIGGQIETLPGIPQMHITEDTAQSLNYDISTFPRHQWRRMKAAVPMHEQMAAQPAPLRALYLLEKQDVKEVSVQILSGVEKFSVVQSCVYGPLLPDEHPAIFPLFTALTEQVTVYHIIRPHTRWSVADVTKIILSTAH